MQRPVRNNLQKAANLFFVLFLLLCAVHVQSQDFTRIKARFSIKEKGADGSSTLTMGTVYYDLNLARIVYQVTFPAPEVLVIEGNLLHRVKDGKVESSPLAGPLAKHSVFHLALSGHLSHFGLQNSTYELVDTERDGELLITTWQPPKKDADKRGKLVLAQKNKLLHGLASYAPGNEQLASKQVFKNYLYVQGFAFPGEVLQIVYFDQGESTKITTYKDVELNESDGTWYNYVVPAE